MAAGTMSWVEGPEVHNPTRRDHLFIHGIARATSGGNCHQCRDKKGGPVHRASPSPPVSSLIPDASMPARKASGIRCHVLIRSCRETTIPSTIPKATSDATNQLQPITCVTPG